MNTFALKILLIIRQMNQLALAKALGISRQAVSLWFKRNDRNGLVAADARHILKIAQIFNVSAELLLKPTPNFNDQQLQFLNVKYLWDRLYPSVFEFAYALAIFNKRAEARLVEIDGLFKAAKVIGKRAWKDFSKYKQYIHPVRRKELEAVWNLQKNLTLI